jgi:predicted DNA-binding WGR domain protein
MSIIVEPRYFEHEGGTKFYEVIQFHHLDKKCWVMVKRWGKLSAAGETMVESFSSARACQAAAEKIIKSKTGRGYLKTSSHEGFHGRGTSYSESELLSAAVKHYGLEFGRRLAADLKIGDEIRGKELTQVWMDEAADIVCEEPAPEPDRGESWASW